MQAMPKRHVILMADIIGSSDRPGKRLMRRFLEMVDGVNAGNADRLLSPLTVTLGDEFQGVPESVDAAVDLIIALEQQRVHQQADFLLRYVIVEGVIETPLNPVRAHEMLGPGLTRAREQLAGLKSSDRRLHVELRPRHERKQDLLQDAGSLYLWITGGWSDKYLKTVSLFLQDKSYNDIARTLRVDLSTAYRRYDSLGMQAYLTARRLFQHLGA
jgi:hypothetical protein